MTLLELAAVLLAVDAAASLVERVKRWRAPRVRVERYCSACGLPVKPPDVDELINVPHCRC